MSRRPFRRSGGIVVVPTTYSGWCLYLLGVFTRVRVEFSLLLDYRVRHPAANPSGF